MEPMVIEGFMDHLIKFMDNPTLIHCQQCPVSIHAARAFKNLGVRYCDVCRLVLEVTDYKCPCHYHGGDEALMLAHEKIFEFNEDPDEFCGSLVSHM